MRKLTTLMYFFMAAALFLTSCGGDDEDPEPIQPTVMLTSSSSITGDAVKGTNDTLSFTIDLRQGDANLKTLTIREGAGSAAPSAPGIASYSVYKNDGSKVEGEVDGNYDVKDNAIYTIKFNPKGVPSTYTYVFGLTDKDDVSADALEVMVTVKVATENTVPKLYSQNGTGNDALAVGSFYSTSKNSTYATASAVANLASLDFALNEPTNGSYRLVRPQGQATQNTDITSSTAAKTMFSTTSLDISTVTVSQLTSASASAVEIALTEGATYFYSNSNTGVKGLIKINTIDTVNDRISFTVKFIME